MHTKNFVKDTPFFNEKLWCRYTISIYKEGQEKPIKSVVVDDNEIKTEEIPIDSSLIGQRLVFRLESSPKKEEICSTATKETQVMCTNLDNYYKFLYNFNKIFLLNLH